MGSREEFNMIANRKCGEDGGVGMWCFWMTDRRAVKMSKGIPWSAAALKILIKYLSSRQLCFNYRNDTVFQPTPSMFFLLFFFFFMVLRASEFMTHSKTTRYVWDLALSIISYLFCLGVFLSDKTAGLARLWACLLTWRPLRFFVFFFFTEIST